MSTTHNRLIRSPASKATCASTVDVDGGKVKKAWSSGQMWRGVELILLGRDPRDAWAITQRICGVCTTVHAIASVRAVENALQTGGAAQRPVHPQPDHPGARGA